MVRVTREELRGFLILLTLIDLFATVIFLANPLRGLSIIVESRVVAEAKHSPGVTLTGSGKFIEKPIFKDFPYNHGGGFYPLIQGTKLNLTDQGLLIYSDSEVAGAIIDLALIHILASPLNVHAEIEALSSNEVVDMQISYLTSEEEIIVETVSFRFNKSGELITYEGKLDLSLVNNTCMNWIRFRIKVTSWDRASILVRRITIIPESPRGFLRLMIEPHDMIGEKIADCFKPLDQPHDIRLEILAEARLVTNNGVFIRKVSMMTFSLMNVELYIEKLNGSINFTFKLLEDSYEEIFELGESIRVSELIDKDLMITYLPLTWILVKARAVSMDALNICEIGIYWIHPELGSIRVGIGKLSQMNGKNS
ncbi:MAG: hypothetical protein ACTSX9_05050 [Candidatus Njordarchaeales archaeon]